MGMAISHLGWCVVIDVPDVVDIDTTIFEIWQDRSLRYLWREIKPLLRKIRWLNNRSEPRWRSQRWKAKT